MYRLASFPAALRTMLTVTTVVLLAACGSMAPTTGPATSTTGANSPAVTHPPLPSPTLASNSPIAPAAHRLWGDWVADAPPLGLIAQGPRIQMSIAWQDGRTAWVSTNYANGELVFNSDVVTAPDGQLKLVAQNASDGCAAGDAGTYAWDRSPDGLFLTLTLVADDCAARATTFARTWVHTLSAVTDGGPGVFPVNNIELTMPQGRFGLGGANGTIDLNAMNGSTPVVQLLIVPQPIGLQAPCSATNQQTTLPMQGTAAIVAYLRALPGLTIKTANATIDGHAAVHVTGSPRAGAPCPAGDTRLFATNDGSGDYWTLQAGASLSMWVTTLGGTATVIWYHGDQVTASEEARLIGTLHSITALPMPS